VRNDGFGRGVEAARPARAAPLDAAVADLVALEAALEDRPVEGTAPAPAEAALSREAGGLRLRIAEPAPAARQHRLELGEIAHVGGELEAGAIERVHLAAHTRAEARPVELEAVVALLAVLGVPVEAPAEGVASVLAGLQVDAQGPADRAGLALGPAHVELSRRRRPDPELAPAEEHAQDALAVRLFHAPRIATGRLVAVGGTSIASRAEPPSVSTSRSRITSPLVPS
jgi:hypothetical protein